MAMAEVIAKRSKDPSTQVGAVLVGDDNRILSLGYNGAPNGWDDKDFPWAKVHDDELELKYHYVIHAESNAIMNFDGILSRLRGARVYVTHFPCVSCAKQLAQVGVRKIFYKNTHDLGGSVSTQAALRLFEACGIELQQVGEPYEP